MYNKSVSINLDSKCNASCYHCCFSCSPSSTIKMDSKYIEKVVREFASHDEIEVISFTGGEIFLDYPFLKRLMEIIQPYNKQITLISNGFWGLSEKLVKQYFMDFKKYNVVALTISFDEYHSPFVKTSSVKRIFRYSRKYPNLSVTLNMAVTKDKMSDRLIEELGEDLLGIKTTKFPMIKVGTAKNKIEDDNIHKLYNINRDKELLYCPGFEVVYHHDGEIYPCCSPAIFETPISLREDEEQSFDRTIEKLNSNLLLFILRKEGFSWFINVIKREKMEEKFNLPEDFSSICVICGLLFNDVNKIKFFESFMKDYYYEYSKV